MPSVARLGLLAWRRIHFAPAEIRRRLDENSLLLSLGTAGPQPDEVIDGTGEDSLGTKQLDLALLRLL